MLDLGNLLLVVLSELGRFIYKKMQTYLGYGGRRHDDCWAEKGQCNEKGRMEGKSDQLYCIRLRDELFSITSGQHIQRYIHRDIGPDHMEHVGLTLLFYFCCMSVHGCTAPII